MTDNERFTSHIDRAASLPQDAPHILSVDESKPYGAAETCCGIDISDFENTLRDPKVIKFAAEAVAYRKQLIDEGRDCTGTVEL